MRKLKRNMAKCKKCGDIIESKHVHDFRWCKCETIAVDGGLEYAKRCYKAQNPDDVIEELSEYED